MKKYALWVLMFLHVALPTNAFAAVEKLQYQNATNNLRIEVLQNDLIHVVYQKGPMVNPSIPMKTTAFVEKKSFVGPTSFRELQNGFQTKSLKVVVYTQSLCIRIYDLEQNNNLTKICPKGLGETIQSLHLDTVGLTHAYGLGQELVSPGSINGDWLANHQRTPGEMGNQMVPFDGGHAGNTQIPILYGLGQGKKAFGLYVDSVYKQKWVFSPKLWRAVVTGDDRLSFFVMTGPSLQDLRKDYMALTGHPLVPPKKMFGFWLSEDGFDSWQEIENKKQALLKDGFPLDGFMLDKQWFGGFKEKSPATPVGSLTWDSKNFVNPAQTLDALAEKNLGVMLIEYPYVGRDNYKDKKSFQGYMVKDALGEPVYLDYQDQWGVGGMLDFTYDKGANGWHDWKRQPLVEQKGVLGFWTTFGQPSMYREDDALYAGGKRHMDVHNLYNFYWNQSIVDGYKRNKMTKRPFMLTESGGPGSQRWGVAMRSGGLAARLSSLASHYNAQMHMSLSGIDYYGSDIGGFERQAGPAQNTDAYQALYSLWLANASWTDIPVRAHASNANNQYETSPASVGWTRSNRIQMMRRYALTPYYYSLGHQAYHQANPIVAPMVYYFQEDPQLRSLADQKMIGPWIMVALHVTSETDQQEVYLPQGTWYKWGQADAIESGAQGLQRSEKVIEDKRIVDLPAYVRAGAIIPTFIFEQDMSHIHVNAAKGIEWKIYPSTTTTSFDHYEDDGQTTAYINGKYNHWLVQQKATEQDIHISWTSQKYNADKVKALPQTMVVTYPNIGKTKVIELNKQPLSKKQFRTIDKNQIWINPGLMTSNQPFTLRIELPKR